MDEHLMENYVRYLNQDMGMLQTCNAYILATSHWLEYIDVSLHLYFTDSLATQTPCIYLSYWSYISNPINYVKKSNRYFSTINIGRQTFVAMKYCDRWLSFKIDCGSISYIIMRTYISNKYTQVNYVCKIILTLMLGLIQIWLDPSC